jgi:hypothetical protein
LQSTWNFNNRISPKEVKKSAGKMVITNHGRTKNDTSSAREFCKHGTAYGGLQTFGTAIAAIEIMAL